mmetsp:Transcript_15476/g.24023  ORF Transcript_15476/g.24023 Transcript_15476/m.24023 type:complete len:230 (-) Transcript_15476:30-719(-)
MACIRASLLSEHTFPIAHEICSASVITSTSADQALLWATTATHELNARTISGSTTCCSTMDAHHSDDVAKLISMREAFNLSTVVAAAVLRQAARRDSNTVFTCGEVHSNNSEAVSCCCSIEPARACCSSFNDSDEFESRKVCIRRPSCCVPFMFTCICICTVDVEAPLPLPQSSREELMKRRLAIRSDRFDFRIWADISLLRWVISRRLDSCEAFVGAIRWGGLLMVGA